jgi:hypothetical protein
MTGLDPIAMSVVVKAVDFLFDQAAEIVQELRRKSSKEVKTGNVNTAGSGSDSAKADVLNALKTVSSEINAKEIEHSLDQIQIYLNNVHAFETQIAYHGGRKLARRDLVNNLDVSQEELQKWIQKLKSLLEDSAQREISIQGL